MVFCRGISGSSPGKFLNSKAESDAFQCFSGHFSQIPIPPLSLKIFLFRFTLISRMVLGDGKKSEDSVPCPVVLLDGRTLLVVVS